MTAKQITQIHKLVTQAEKAARVVERNQFLIANHLGLDEIRRGKAKQFKSAKELFRKLSI